MEKLKVNNIAAVGLFYRKFSPTRIFLEMKDDGYPFEVFRNHLNMIGGNWIGDVALADKNPRDTFVREVCEELSFERDLIDSGDYEKLGFGAHAPYRQKINSVMPTAKDNESLAELKECVRNNAQAMGDFIFHTPAEVFARVPQKKVREALTALVSFYAVPVPYGLWNELSRIQEKFENISNESVTVLTTVGEIVKNNLAFGWGQEKLLTHFMYVTQERKSMWYFPGVSGIEMEAMGDPLPSYDEYLKKYEITKHP